ncbi:MAG: heat-inducible transcription repressor HrcA [Pseudomonadales bacterium]|nr:heat-inducible transcription repressor HrcA [Pseudomonadales bacterium]
MNINPRAQQLLKILIERYIIDGQPVGSKTLAEVADLSVSSATIRNILSELEGQGYIQSPYTSAGRIPTERGYRFFVDSLLTIKPLAEHEIFTIRQNFDPDKPAQMLVEAASKMLSRMTQLAAVVTLPAASHTVLRQVEFLPLSNTRVLVILVFNEKEVENRVIHAERAYSSSELQEAANYINHNYLGQGLDAIRKDLFDSVKKEQVIFDLKLQAVRDLAGKAFEVGEQSAELLLSGYTHLLNADESESIEQAKALLETLQHKKDMLHLLEGCIGAQGVQLFIGQESGHQMLGDCSIITAPYELNADTVGVLGIIGPTRMAYEKVIPVVDITAKILGAALNSTG